LLTDVENRGEPKAAAECWSGLSELRNSDSQMAQESPGRATKHCIGAEAWLRLIGQRTRALRNRAHFISAAAEAMRRILIESGAPPDVIAVTGRIGKC